MFGNVFRINRRNGYIQLVLFISLSLLLIIFFSTFAEDTENEIVTCPEVNCPIPACPIPACPSCPICSKCPTVKPSKPYSSNSLENQLPQLLQQMSANKGEVIIGRTNTDPIFFWSGPNTKQDIVYWIRTNGIWSTIETLIYYTILRDRCDPLKSLDENPFVIDVGANVGYFALFAAKMGCKVLAFEPVPEPLKHFKLATLLNGLQNRIDIQDKAVDAQNGTVHIDLTPDWGVSHKSNEGMEVDSVTLTDYIKQDVTLLKIDVEGYEDGVFRGLEQAFEKYNIENMIIEIKKMQDVDYKRKFINTMKTKYNYEIVSFKDQQSSTFLTDISVVECEKLAVLGPTDWFHEDVWFVKKDSPTWEKVHNKVKCMKRV